MKNFSFALLALTVLTGCTHYTLTKEQCAVGDWVGLGYSDGSVGYTSAERLHKHQTACQQHSITVNTEKYMEGWNKGVIPFCTSSNGYQQGLKGYHYANICPPKLEAGFLEGYEKGKRLYEVRSKYENYVKQSRDLRSRIDMARKDLASAKTPRDRDMAADQISRLEREKEDVDREVRLYEMKHANSLVD